LEAYPVDEYFIDIGIPDDYARAVRELPQYELPEMPAHLN
jgi:NDP-sugar pyrophosphorylase family protein